MTGVINAIPYVFAAGAMVLWGRHSDRTGERPAMSPWPTCRRGGLIATALMTDPVLTMAMLVIATMGRRPPVPPSGHCRPPCCRAPRPPAASP